MNKLAMTSIKVQKDIHFKMQKRVISDGYGMRGKSKWILEAIEGFLKIPQYLDFVDMADEATQLEEVISLRLPEDIKEKLENAFMEVRRIYPTMEGVKSKLIRASIIQRIFRGELR